MNPELWRAKKVIDSTLHPGEFVLEFEFESEFEFELGFEFESEFEEVEVRGLVEVGQGGGRRGGWE